MADLLIFGALDNLDASPASAHWIVPHVLCCDGWPASQKHEHGYRKHAAFKVISDHGVPFLPEPAALWDCLSGPHISRPEELHLSLFGLNSATPNLLSRTSIIY